MLEENYGEGPLNTPQLNQDHAGKRSTNAYILFYVRESAMDEVLAPLSEEDMPSHLSVFFLQLSFFVRSS